MNKNNILDKKGEKKVYHKDEKTTQPVQNSVEDVLQVINDSVEELNGFVEHYDKKVEEYKEENKELLDKYKKYKDIIEKHKNVKIDGILKTFYNDTYAKVISVCGPISLTAIAAFTITLIGSGVFIPKEVGEVLTNAFVSVGFLVIPAASALSAILTPLTAKRNERKYEELNMSEEDVEVINKKVEKNKLEIEKMKELKPQLLDAIKKLKASYVNMKFEEEEKKASCIEQTDELENTYEDSYVDSYDDTVASAYCIAPAPEKPKSLAKIHK